MSVKMIYGEEVDMPTGAIMGAEFILPNQRNWSEYEKFLECKKFTPVVSGLTDIPSLNPAMFPHQRDVTSWALRLGRLRRVPWHRNGKNAHRRGVGADCLKSYRLAGEDEEIGE